ncbi:hypothetical protein LCGC14_0280630 [marine sediment metagenome]|uniref:Uncharacterized protein n=1 Tax=marine sediment metagenome TaxID=412755 RepID=A0A0F9TW26_9ZZZZ
MSDNRRIRRKEERRKKIKYPISKKDKTLGILAIVLLFLLTVLLFFYFSIKGIKI